MTRRTFTARLAAVFAAPLALLGRRRVEAAPANSLPIPCEPALIIQPREEVSPAEIERVRMELQRYFAMAPPRFLIATDAFTIYQKVNGRWEPLPVRGAPHSPVQVLSDSPELVRLAGERIRHYTQRGATP